MTPALFTSKRHLAAALAQSSTQQIYLKISVHEVTTIDDAFSAQARQHNDDHHIVDNRPENKNNSADTTGNRDTDSV